MMKVLDRADSEECGKALQMTNRNMHHAIKLVKLKKLIKVNSVTDADMLSTLEAQGWDVASYIMKLYFYILFFVKINHYVNCDISKVESFKKHFSV